MLTRDRLINQSNGTVGRSLGFVIDSLNTSVSLFIGSLRV